MALSKKKFITIVIATLLLIFLTRGLIITHNIELHCDEKVFFTAAQSLKGYISGSSPVYEEVKEYPEGAIVYYLPFHILTAVINRVFNVNIDPQITGRIAAIVYFSAGAVLGFIILRRFLAKKPACFIVYGLVMVFSLLHIEQSRYGTGDPVTCFVLMSIILLTATALSAKRRNMFYLFSAVFLSGSLCAVKYPLLFFVIIPLYGLIVLLTSKSGKAKFGYALAFIVILYAGFACFSPKAAFDPSYIVKVCDRELDAYVGGSILSQIKIILPRLWSNFMCTVSYALLYADFPFALIFFVLEVVKCRKGLAASTKNNLDVLFYTLLPLLIVVFLAYNMFVSLLFMRSLYPLFFLTELYAATYIGNLFYTSKFKRVITIALTVLMVLRGAYLVVYMVTDNAQERIEKLTQEAVNDSWNKTTFLSGPALLPHDSFNLENGKQIGIADDRFSSREAMELKPGEMFITGARDHGLYPSTFTFLPSSYAKSFSGDRWLEFKDVNSQYYCSSLYPEYIYYLFGYWIYGTSTTCCEFPTVYIYYRP